MAHMPWRSFPMWHPVSLLLAWAGFVLALQWMPVRFVMVSALLCLVMAECFARQRSRRLLYRTRWLLLSLVILFIFMTPGEYMPGITGQSGVTYEGLYSAGEQCGRLLALLTSLALLNEHLGTRGILAGLYCLMGPWPGRRNTVVRLMLVLESVEAERMAHWRDWLDEDSSVSERRESCHLVIPRLQWQDWLLIVSVLAGLAGWMVVR